VIADENGKNASGLRNAFANSAFYCVALRIHSRRFLEKYKAAEKYWQLAAPQYQLFKPQITNDPLIEASEGRAGAHNPSHLRALQEDHKKVDFDQYRIAHVLSQWMKRSDS